MANIGESRTSRLARERLEAIKKFIPVRDSVREKLKARQEAKIEFAEGAEELFKPVTAATTDVKTAITGKIDPVDPTKSVPGLLQAIEGLKKEQEAADAGAVAIARETFIDKFTEDGIKKIRNIPLTNIDELREFSTWIVTNYYRRREFLKPGTDKGMSQADWRDYVYKVHRGIPRISPTDDTYSFIKTGVIGVNKEIRDQRKIETELAKEAKKQAKIQAKAAKEAKKGKKTIKQKDPVITDPDPEEEDDDFGTSTAFPQQLSPTLLEDQGRRYLSATVSG